MIAYVFRVSDRFKYDDVAVEPFENAAELFSALLIRGVNYQLKRGLHHCYQSQTESLSSPRGKIDISESIKQLAPLKMQLVCTHEVFTSNSYFNRIIKITMHKLLKADISGKRRRELQKLSLYFKDVTALSAFSIDWRMRYDSNTQSYRMLIGVCYLVLNGLLQTKQSGRYRVMNFLDMRTESALFEQFVRAYFKKEHPELNTDSPYIRWAVDDGFDEKLPKMKTDVTLSTYGKVLIIDTKYYSRITQYNFGKMEIRSSHLYQIYSYVSNYEYQLKNEGNCEVEGMLLYASTDELFQPDLKYRIHGKTIVIRTLNLNLEFSQITAELDGIAREVSAKDRT